MFGAIILIAIAVAVTVVTSGAAAAAVASSLPGTSVGLGSGITLAFGGTAAGLTATTAGLATFGAIGAAVGSVASQAFGVATGLQDRFSWKGVALAGISGGVGGALGSVIRGGGFLAGAARGAGGSAITQGIGVATGLQSKFDWAGIAAAGIGGGVGPSVGSGSELNLGRFPGIAAGGLANAATRSLIKGTDFGDNLIAALPDIVGNTVGNLVAGEIAGGGRSGGMAGSGSAEPQPGAGGGQVGEEGDIVVTAPSGRDWTPAQWDSYAAQQAIRAAQEERQELEGRAAMPTPLPVDRRPTRAFDPFDSRQAREGRDEYLRAMADKPMEKWNDTDQANLAGLNQRIAELEAVELQIENGTNDIFRTVLPPLDYFLSARSIARSEGSGWDYVTVGSPFAGAALGGVVSRLGRTSGGASKFVGQGFNPAQADYLAEPYVGMGHHFIPRRAGLPSILSDSPLNVLRPKGISRGDFYELHFKVDPFFNGTRLPNAVGGGVWRGSSLGLEKYGTMGQLWYGSPTPLKVTVGGAAGGAGGAAYWYYNDGK